MHHMIQKVTARIVEKSRASRARYLSNLNREKQQGCARKTLSCGNLAHGYAVCQSSEKTDLKSLTKMNVGIVTAFNDMLSAHQPYQNYPDAIKKSCRDAGHVAQVAAGVPAMCDGVIQGQPGMELSLLSRDVIAMSTSLGLAHQMFDGALLLGICDKIVPGLLIGGLSFGHLPMMFVPAGPMASGLPNKEKARIRQEFAEGKASREALLEAESQSYHSHGTCTFYGTANSNQLVMEMMGLQLPGSSFVHPDSPLRMALTDYSARHITRIGRDSGQYTPVGEVVNEKSLVNGLVGLLATGGSTNLTIHMIAIARSAGIMIDWNDFNDLSKAVPLLAKVYPNGQADINHFHAAGGIQFLVRTLLDAGLLHEDVPTVAGQGLRLYTKEPKLMNGHLNWVEGATHSLDETVLRAYKNAFSSHGGLTLLEGNLGRSVIKTSAVEESRLLVEGPAVVLNDQDELKPLFEAGKLNRDCVIVVRGQGPKANGMPELHKLMPILGSLHDKGYRVALVTDGRMSGASGKVPAAIHMSPEAVSGGLIGKIQEGDPIRLDPSAASLEVLIPSHQLQSRPDYQRPESAHAYTLGRGLFAPLREQFSTPEEGALSIRSFEHLLASS
jgi:phosphogluconate dehydratase